MSFTVELGKTFSVSSEPLGIWMGREGGAEEGERERKWGEGRGEETKEEEGEIEKEKGWWSGGDRRVGWESRRREGNVERG